MHKFFKGLPRAFRCQNQSSARNTTTASTQPENTDDTIPGYPESQRVLCFSGYASEFSLDNNAVRTAVEDSSHSVGEWACGLELSRRHCTLESVASSLTRFQSVGNAVMDTFISSLLAFIQPSVRIQTQTTVLPSSAACQQLTKLAHWLSSTAKPGAANGAIGSGYSAVPNSCSQQSKVTTNHNKIVLRRRTPKLAATASLQNAASRSTRKIDAWSQVGEPPPVTAKVEAPYRAETFSTSRHKVASKPLPDAPLPKQSLLAHLTPGTKAEVANSHEERLFDMAARHLLSLAEEVAATVPLVCTASSASMATDCRDNSRVHCQLSSATNPEEMPNERAAPHEISKSGAAAYNLGLCYEHGWGVALDRNQAAEYYKRAVAVGHAASSYNLAQLYLSDNSLNTCVTGTCTARRLMDEAARNNLAEAQIWLGATFFEEGQYKAAVEQFQKAASQQVPLAQYYLAVCYEKGFGTEQDMAEAARLYKRAAAGGVADALYNLGIFYEDGLGGLPQDLVLASEMFGRAESGSWHDEHTHKQSLQPSSTEQRIHPSSSSGDLEDGSKVTRTASLPKSASLPAFSQRITKMMASFDQDGVRLRSGEPSEILVRSRWSSLLRSTNEDTSTHSESAEPVFFLSESEDSESLHSDSGQSGSAISDFTSDVFGESLSNPSFGARLLQPSSMACSSKT